MVLHLPEAPATEEPACCPPPLHAFIPRASTSAWALPTDLKSNHFSFPHVAPSSFIQRTAVVSWPVSTVPSSPFSIQQQSGTPSFSCFKHISVASLCTKNKIQTYHLGLEAPERSAYLPISCLSLLWLLTGLLHHPALNSPCLSHLRVGGVLHLWFPWPGMLFSPLFTRLTLFSSFRTQAKWRPDLPWSIYLMQVLP